jgi:hypothetical protein
MSRSHRSCAALLALASFGSLVAAQSSSGPYVINPVAIADGGATLGGGQFRLSGTIGQPATGMLAAGKFHLYDGFWAPFSDRIFADSFNQ